MKAIVILFFISATCLMARADNLDEWTLQSQEPQVLGIAASSNLLVAVTAGNDILRSTNASDWILATSAQNPFSGNDGLTTELWATAYGNGVFVTAGTRYSGTNAGLVMNSMDGISWSVAAQAISNGLYALTFARGEFIAVGAHGAVWASTDGNSWTQDVSVTTNDLKSVCYGNGLFVAVGYSTVITSSDGINWTGQTAGGLGKAVAYGQGRFVEVGAFTNYWTSIDGTNWSQGSLPYSSSFFYPLLYSINYAHGTFLAVGSLNNGSGSSSSTMFTSPDGLTWAQRSSVPTNVWYNSILWNDTFIVVGGGIEQSEPFSGPNVPPRFIKPPQSQLVLDGQQYSLSAVGIAYPPLTYQWQLNGQPISHKTNSSITISATFNNAGDYTLVESNITGVAASLPATVTVIGNPTLLSPTNLPATLNGSITLGTIVSNNTSVNYAWQMNGTNIPLVTNAALTLTNIQLAQSGLYATVVSNSAGVVTNTPIYVTVQPYANDPLCNWTYETPGYLPSILNGGGLTAVRYGNGVFVTVGEISGSDFGVILSSSDGLNWMQRLAVSAGQPVQIDNLYDLAFGNGIFVAVGYESTIYTSTNGTDWNLTQKGAYATSISKVVFKNNMFYAQTYGGQAISSSNGTNWQTIPFWLDYSDPVAFGGGYYGAIISSSQKGLMFSTNNFNWFVGYFGSNFLNSVIFGNGRFVAVGVSGAIVASQPLTQLAVSSAQLKIGGLVGRQYQIQSRDMLSGANGWSNLTNLLLTNNPTMLPVDGTAKQRFYRAVLQP